ncbi:MAG: MFS transporter [Clostridia bacterium]
MDKVGKSYSSSLVALVFAMFSLATGVGFIVPLLPVYAESLGASGAWIGLIFAANPLFRAAFMVVFGALADQRGKKKIMSFGLAGYVVLSLGFVFVTEVYHLFVLRMLQGVCSAMIAPVARAYAGEISPAHREGKVMGTLNMGFFAGFSGGPLIGGLFADEFGFNVPFYAMAVLTSVSLLLVYLYLPEQSTVGERRNVLSIPVLMESLGLLRYRLVAGAVSLRSSVGVGHGIFSTLLPLVGQLAMGLSAAQVGFVVTARSLLAALLQPLGGRLADRYNRRWMGLASSLLIPLGFLVVTRSETFPHMIFVGILIGLGFGISVPSAEAMAVERGREHGMGRMMGLNEMARSLAMGAGSVIGGVAMDLFGAINAHVLAAIISVLGLAGAMWLLRGYRPPSRGLQGARMQKNE